MIDLNNILGDGIGNMQLVQQVGDDKMIVNAARVSFGQDNDNSLTDKDIKLINYLVREKHTSPFEHNLLTVKVRLPLNIGEQWLRHRIGWSYNKESGRYIDMSKQEPEFYIPTVFRPQSSNNRQASLEWTPEIDPDPMGLHEHDLIQHYLIATKLYKDLVSAGVAKEQARMVLPQALYMSMYATCNLNSLMHFIKLRDHAGAQWEMQQYARALLQIAKEFWPACISAMGVGNGS